MNRCPECHAEIAERDFPASPDFGTACRCYLPREEQPITEEEITMLGLCACGSKREVCGCANCDAPLMCRQCFFDHREQVHGYEVPEKRTTEVGEMAMEGVDLGEYSP